MTFAATPRSRSEDRRISPVFWVLLAVLGTSGWAVYQGYGNASFGVFLFVVAGWMVSLCLHEYAHARTALHGGDISVGAKGYLTLNPLKYANVLLSFVLPIVFVILGGIGLPGGSVWIERHRIQGRLKHSLISAAGPLVNLLIAAALLVPIGTGWLDDPTVHAFWEGHELIISPFSGALGFLGFLQLSAAVLNLLPVPGLDGYGIVEPWLSYQTRRAIEPFAPYGMLAVFALLWQPQVNEFFFGIVHGLMNLFGVDQDYATLGRYLFSFWKN
ncbi:site-2 protease family protein [Kitasatospora xanthocidica]|uniref:Site-2 protease family protein n=1 Tax=Kitasatospora xanthocidica TaxID=83382 RepID=A0A372ZUT3_9ACTN|nr:site-2 protease family protein [Kitasatospora xanthocidica]RGD59234.1 site-2 protease family protein [Kitasatospora xanthocidica]